MTWTNAQRRGTALLACGLMAAALLVGPAAPPAARAQMIPSTLQTLSADTPAAPTAVPPTAEPAVATATSGPEDEDDDGDRDRAQSAPTALPSIEGATATRTRRPTRTPRTTATTTPTPLVAGGLQLDISSAPPVLLTGSRAELTVSVLNRTAARVADLTFQVTLPEEVLVDAVDGAPGLTSRSGSIVRWYLPGLEPGASEDLRLSGLVSRASTEVRLCALLLSAGSPADLCAVLTSTSGVGPEAEGPALASTPVSTADLDLGPGQSGAALDRGTLGLGVLLLGLGALGVALGLRRPRPGSPEATSPDPPIDG